MPDIRRFCEFPGCHEHAEKGGHYCKKHAILKEKQRRLAQLQSHDKSPSARECTPRFSVFETKAGIYEREILITASDKNIAPAR